MKPFHASANQTFSFGPQSHPQSASLRNRGRVLAVAVAITTAILLSVGLLDAQVAGTGTIAGTISDPSGAVIPGAVVTVTNMATGLVSTQTTPEAGTYSIVALPAGEYTVSVRANGFTTLVQQHVVLSSQTQGRPGP